MNVRQARHVVRDYIDEAARSDRHFGGRRALMLTDAELARLEAHEMRVDALVRRIVGVAPTTSNSQGTLTLRTRASDTVS